MVVIPLRVHTPFLSQSHCLDIRRIESLVAKAVLEYTANASGTTRSQRKAYGSDKEVMDLDEGVNEDERQEQGAKR